MILYIGSFFVKEILRITNFKRNPQVMKILLTQLFILYAIMLSAQNEYDGKRIAHSYWEFEKGSTELLYGDRVVLRKSASAQAEALDTLKIGSEVKIMQRTEDLIEVNGRESNWYKVKTKSGVGFIPGGFIALDSREFNGGVYLVIVAGKEDDLKVRARYSKNGDYFGKECDLNTSAFQLEVSGNRGVEGIESMLVIDLFAEACGVDGGKIYLFNDGASLIEAMSCSEVADGGVFWFSESLRFPDEIGWGNSIIYEREFGEAMDEELMWTKATVHNVTLEWRDGQFVPDISTFNFDEE